MNYFYIYIVMINLITFLVYGQDKKRAKRRRFRISEATLFWLALIGGSVGAFFAMQIFRHKTKKITFVVGIPLILLAQLILTAIFIFSS